MGRSGGDEAGEAAWDDAALPDLSGRTYLITGATRGLGYFASEQLARAGAHVVMTGRNPNRLAAARAAVIRRAADAGSVVEPETLLLDTSNLGSVRAAAATARRHRALHGLLLNAAIVHAPKHRETTADGIEIVFATNVLGHFALAGALLVPLAAACGRMVWLGSLATSLVRVDLVDPQLVEHYHPWRAYAQSKVATTALGLEADRRLRAARVPVQSVVAHPGYALSGRTPGIRGVNEPSKPTRFADNLQALFAQSKEAAARSPVRALIDPQVQGGELWGPRLVLRGAPRPARPAKGVDDPAAARRLWKYCESAAGTSWPLQGAARTGGE